MKRGLIVFASIFLVLTNFISAYSYSSTSITDLFANFGGDNLWLLIVFFVSLALITTILNRTRFFEENRAASGVISLMLSLGITYGLYSKGIMFDVTEMFYGLGFSDMAIDLFVFFITAGLGLFLRYKFRTHAFLVVGGILVALGGFGIIEQGLLFIVGIGLVIVWIILMMARNWRQKDSQRVYGMSGPKIPGRFNVRLRGIPKFR